MSRSLSIYRAATDIEQHLAMAEMRAILARVLWHFDISLCKESENWDQQKVFLLWDKPDLMVRLSARNQGRCRDI